MMIKDFNYTKTLLDLMHEIEHECKTSQLTGEQKKDKVLEIFKTIVISEFGANSFVIHSFPADIDYSNERQIIDEFIEQFKMGAGLGKFSRRENVAKSLSYTAAIKPGKILSALEMQNLIDELFACENPMKAPNGRKTFVKYTIEDLEKALDK